MARRKKVAHHLRLDQAGISDAEIGLVESTPESLRLTRDGMLLADEVCTEFYAEEDKEALRKANATKYGPYLDPID